MIARLARAVLTFWLLCVAATPSDGAPPKQARTKAVATRPAAPQPAATNPAQRTVFAAPFENETGQEQYSPAAAGMGDLVAVLLAQQKHIRVVERQRLLMLTAEQAKSLKGLTGNRYAIRAGRFLKADTVLVGRLFLIKNKLTVSVKALDIATSRVIASDQLSCRPVYLLEAALQLARKLGKQMSLPLPEIDLKKIDASPIASLHFAKALAHYYAGNMDAAIMQFMRTMDLDPDYVEGHYFCGLCHYRLFEYAHAAIEWRKYLKRQPDGMYSKRAKKLLAEARKHEKESSVQRLGPASRPSETPK